jgi:hypothetical protein
MTERQRERAEKQEGMMTRSGRGMAPRGPAALLLVAALALLLAGPPPARAEFGTLTLSLLIDNGLQLTLATDLAGLAAFAGPPRAVRAVANGVALPGSLGTATVRAWSRPVPDPAFGPLGAFAGLIVLDLGGTIAHLSLIETPGGVVTAIGVVDDPRVVGTWTFASGAGVGGGDADDLLVSLLIRLGTPTTLAERYFLMTPYFGVAGDAGPDPGGSATTLSSFYGQAEEFTPSQTTGTVGPLFGTARGYTGRAGIGASLVYGHLLAIHTGGSAYLLQACSGGSTIGNRCTASGGGVLALVTGSGSYFSAITFRRPGTILYLVPAVSLP